MNFFESFGKSVQKMDSSELKAKGLEGICMECSGKGHVNATVFSDGKICAHCHGKGFLKHDSASQDEPFSQSRENLH